MKLKFLIFLTLIIGTTLFAKNPIIDHIYTADPSAHIWPDDSSTLWVYASHDAPGTNHHATMFDYHVFSTKDLVNWTDHGRVLSVDDVDWAISHAWAIDAAYWNDQYYLIYCMIEAKTGMFRAGLAISEVPQGPFKDIGFVENVEWGQDPAVFIDQGIPWLFWGLGGKGYAAQLNNDLKTIIPETKVDLTSQLKEIFEGPWVHKYKNKYYCSYPALIGGTWPEEMCYAIADHPLGPYEYQGIYIPEFDGQAGTNHGSIIKFKGQWIAFHHSSWLSGGLSETRCMMADYLVYNEDGTIKPIIPSKEGLNPEKSKCVLHLEAENAEFQGGRLAATLIDSSLSGYSGSGYVTGFDVRNDYVQVLVQVAKELKAGLKIRYSATEDYHADILVGNTMMAGWDGLPMKKTDQWEEVDLGIIELKQGDNRIRFTAHKDANLKIDYFRIVFE